MPTADDLRNQARRCRRLAKQANEREAKILTEMADEYEARARAMEAPSGG